MMPGFLRAARAREVEAEAMLAVGMAVVKAVALEAVEMAAVLVVLPGGAETARAGWDSEAEGRVEAMVGAATAAATVEMVGEWTVDWAGAVDLGGEVDNRLAAVLAAAVGGVAARVGGAQGAALGSEVVGQEEEVLEAEVRGLAEGVAHLVD